MSLRKISGGTLLSFGVLLTFAPLLSAEAQDIDVPGNLTMHDSTDPTVGNVLKEGVPFLHNFGTNNTFLGSGAGNLSMTGSENTGNGAAALFTTSTGTANTATGFGALGNNDAGSRNTANGRTALFSNTSGNENTAIGSSALYFNITGNFNTASGANALRSNTTGSENTATGAGALSSNTGGSFNTASGTNALFSNTTGSYNTASGDGALQSNISGSYNTAIGQSANVSVGDLVNATAIGYGAIVDANNKIRLGNNNVALVETAGMVKARGIQITGGADLSEKFEVAHSQSRIEPGMVVAIHPHDPGRLMISARAYDRRVAGVISGAGGVQPGMLMGQSGTLADGDQPVALSGRVYVWADASNGPIAAGDLLTTSNVPGHAMKVTKHGKAQGAILGKAMTGLSSGRGLVLVLVTLQ